MADKTDLLRPPGSGQSLSLGGLGVIYKVMPEETGGALAVVEHPIDPGRLVRPHTHIREDEISSVIEGEVGIEVGEQEFLVGPGAWVFKPRGVPHTFWNAGSKQARLIEIITPGGFAHYFEELAKTLDSADPPDMQKLAEIAGRYEVSFSLEWVPALKARYGIKLVGE